MPRPEDERRRRAERRRERSSAPWEPHPQIPLVPELADYLKDKEIACLFQATTAGTVLVVKAPAREIRSVRGRVPIELRHELIDHPASPVIRTVLRIYHQPQHPLALETF